MCPFFFSSVVFTVFPKAFVFWYLMVGNSVEQACFADQRVTFLRSMCLVVLTISRMGHVVRYLRHLRHWSFIFCILLFSSFFFSYKFTVILLFSHQIALLLVASCVCRDQGNSSSHAIFRFCGNKFRTL